MVFTGGEPLLQLDAALIGAVHARGFEVAVETNGTLAPPPGLDWICVSPKAGAPLVADAGSELKLVFPQEGLMPDDFSASPSRISGCSRWMAVILPRIRPRPSPIVSIIRAGG